MTDIQASDLLHIYDTLTTALAGAWTDITFNIEIIDGDAYSHGAGLAPILINVDGWYIITYYVTVEQYTENAVPTTCQFKLQENIGAGYVDIAGSFSGVTTVDDTENLNNVSVTIIRSLDNTDLIKLQGIISSGAGAVRTKSSAAGITIRRWDT